MNTRKFQLKKKIIISVWQLIVPEHFIVSDHISCPTTGT